MLLKNDPEIVSGAVRGKDGSKYDAALHHAARFGRVEAIAFLIKNGADISAVDATSDWLPLQHAARTNQAASIEVLLDSGADVNHLAQHARTHDLSGRKLPSETALDIAAEHGASDAVAVLLSRGARLDGNSSESPCSALHHAVRSMYRNSSAGRAADGNRKVIDLLVKGGADLTSRDYLGRQPLHQAVEDLCPETVEYLLERYGDRIDVNVEGQFGYRPLVCAVMSDPVKARSDDRVQVIRILKKFGADITLKSGPSVPNMPPLHYAMERKRDPEVLSLLRE